MAEMTFLREIFYITILMLILIKIIQSKTKLLMSIILFYIAIWETCVVGVYRCGKSTGWDSPAELIGLTSVDKE